MTILTWLRLFIGCVVLHSLKKKFHACCSCFLHTFPPVRKSVPMTHLSIFSLLLADLPLGLILIRQKALVGHLPGNHKVYKITKIAVIPLSDEEPQELELEVCMIMLMQ